MVIPASLRHVSAHFQILLDCIRIILRAHTDGNVFSINSFEGWIIVWEWRRGVDIDEQDERLHVPYFALILQLTASDGSNEYPSLQSITNKIVSIVECR